MKLVVGLGNPGAEYANTRHNVGFEVIDEFATRLGWVTKAADFNRFAKAKFDALVFDGVVGDEKVLLLKPLTYMNVSGRAVAAAAGFYQVPPAEVIVVLDDVALPTGKLRIRGAGSSGGHNGLRDIQRVLGTDAYPRLRIGIDAPPLRVPQSDYVLGRFSDEQRVQLNPAIARACGAIVTWIDKGLNAAMNQFNAEEKKE